MATTQNMTLSGGNAATNQYMNYYNQIHSQLMTNPNTIQAQVIQAPQQMQAQQIAAPDPITAQRIEVDRQGYEDIAKERAEYLRPYLENAIASRRRQTANDRAAADVDAYSRGMGASTWLSDAKNRMAAAEASDIMAAQNEFLGRVGELANQVYENQQNRWLQAELQNEANRLAAEQQNAAYANRVAEYNANALMNADQFNIENALRVAMQNAEYAMQADMFNNQLYQTLEQLAWGRAGDMYNAAMAYDAAQAAGRGGGGRGGTTGDGDVEDLSKPFSLGNAVKNLANSVNNYKNNQVNAVQAAIEAAQRAAAQAIPSKSSWGRNTISVNKSVNMTK